MHNLIPLFILQKSQTQDLVGCMESFILNIDLQGFTMLTQELMRKSDAGAEVLTDVINTIFTPAIDAIEKRGGFIAGFAGDAFTAVFPECNLEGVLVAGLYIRDFFINNGIMDTEYGQYQISVRIGLARGMLDWTIIRAPEQHVYWFSGPGVNRAIEAQEKAQTNQIVIDYTGLLKSEQQLLKLIRISDTHAIIIGADTVDQLVRISKKKLSQKDFVPQEILEQKSEGEFREVLSCFINLINPEEELIRKMVSICKKYGGYFNKVDYTDKGWLALVLFGAPVAYEQTAIRAVNFAYELKVAGQGNIRIGMSFAKAFAGFIGSSRRGEYTALGMAVNLGARFMYKAVYGEVLIDNRIRKEAQQILVSKDLGALTYKGFDKPIQTYKLEKITISLNTKFYQTDFVGREKELEHLKQSCAPIFEGRSGGVSYLYGEAGQGKTRLLYELERTFGERIGLYYLKSDSIIKGALNPFIYWIEQKFITSSGTEMSEKCEVFRQNWQVFSDDLLSIYPDNEQLPTKQKIQKELQSIESILAGMIGLEWENSIFSQLLPKDKSISICFALKSFLEILCLLKPVVLVLEDLHWMDNESREVLQILTRASGQIPFKLIITSRYNDDYTKPFIKFDEEVSTDVIELKGWDIGTIESFCKNILQAPPDQIVLQYLFIKTQGNPFFTEQICLFLKETDQIVLKNGYYQQKGASFSMPENVQAILVARLDRLENRLKRIVQAASILGKEFVLKVLLELLQRLQSQELSLEKTRMQMSSGEQERIWNTINEISYIFSHILLRDAAYQMQLKKNLRKLHLLAGQTMEFLYSLDKAKHAEIAEHYNNSGEWKKAVIYYKSAGKYEIELFHFEDSIRLFSSAIELLKAQLGENNPDIADVLLEIGKVNYEKCEYNEAMERFEQALAINLVTTGENSLETADCYTYIGNVYLDRGIFDAALENHQKALSIKQQIYGEEHSYIASSLLAIGKTYLNKGEYLLALEYTEQALSNRRTLLGEDHPETAESLVLLGTIYKEKGEYGHAIEEYETALRIFRRIKGEKHPETANCLNNCGVAHYYNNNVAKAMEYYDLAMQVWIEVFGERHKLVASGYNNIGSIYCKQGDFIKALDLYGKSLQIWKEIVGEKHPNTANLIHNIGYAYFLKGEVEQAMQCFETAVKIHQEVLGQRHPQMVGHLTNIGYVYFYIGECDKAISYYKESLSVQQEALGENNIKNVDQFQNLGTAYYKKQDFDNALEYYLKALILQREFHGDKSTKTADQLHSIGMTYSKKKEYDFALKYLNEALSIWERTYGDAHQDTISTLTGIAETYENMGDKEKAKIYWSRTEQKN